MPDGSGNKGKIMSDKKQPKSEVLCVVRAEVNAEKGKGKTTALVLKPDGTALFLGATMLALNGFIDDSYVGASIAADTLAGLVGKPLIVGEKNLTAFVKTNEARIKNHKEVIGRVIGDAPGGTSRGGNRGNRCSDL